MKITQLITEIDVGDLEWGRSVMNKAAPGPGSEFWLLDKQTGKKLEGPFKDYDAARSFKQNRPDRIPKDATIKPL